MKDAKTSNASDNIMNVKLKEICVALWIALAVVCTAQTKEKPKVEFAAQNRWAICIGANDYQHISDLNFANRDAAEFSKALIDTFQFDAEKVTLIADGMTGVASPTRANIQSAILKRLKDPALDKGDLFVFYFAGHGMGTDSGDYLLPVDAPLDKVIEQGLPVRTIIEAIVEAGLKNVLFISDACRAGEKNNFGIELITLARKANIAVLLGCEPGRRSYEYAPLSHGVFTYQLLRAMRSRSVRDPITGALWASELTKKVSEDVYQYTERDYPQAPQKPTAFSEKTHDILLGAFLPANLNATGMGQFLTEAKSLSREKYVAALQMYASELFDANRYRETIEVLSTLDQINELTEYGLFLLGFTTLLSERAAESSRYLARLAATTDSDYYRALAQLYNPSTSVSPDAKVEAGIKLWELEPNPSNAIGIASQFKINSVPAEKIAKFFDLVIPELADAPRLQHFLRGEYAIQVGNFDEAQTAYRKARETFGLIPDDYILLIGEYLAAESRRDDQRARAIIEEGARTATIASQRCFWYIKKAQLSQKDGDTVGVIANLKMALQPELEPELLLSVAEIAGFRCAELTAEIDNYLSANPYVWQIWVCKFLAQASTGTFETGMAAFQKITLYVDDPQRAYATSVKLYMQTVRQLVERGEVPANQADYLESLFFVSMIPMAQNFGAYFETWETYMFIGLNSLRIQQVQQSVKKYLLPKLQKGAFGNNLLTLVLLQAITVADWKTVDKIAGFDDFVGVDTVDSKWFLALSYAMQGKFGLAQQMIRQLPPCSENLSEIMRSMELWVRVAMTRDQKLTEELANFKFTLKPSAIMIGLGLAELNRWDLAVPLLLECEDESIYPYGSIYMLGARALHRYGIQKKNLELVNRMAYLGAISQHANPLSKSLHFGLIPGVARFIGSHQYRLIAATDEIQKQDGMPTPVGYSGKLNIQVAKDGVLKGTLLDAQKKVKGTIVGKVDLYGNVTATYSEGSKRQSLIGKLVLKGDFGSNTRLKEQGFSFELLDGDGKRTLWVCNLP